MAIDQHIDFLWSTPHARTAGHRGYALQCGKLDDFSCDVPMRGTSPYDHDLLCRARRIARKLDIELRQGTYLSTLGPPTKRAASIACFVPLAPMQLA